MANKLYAMEQLTEEVAKDVAASPQEWMQFLNTASRLYKYTFPEQLLIYAQRPEATAVASMEIWNQKMYRWIKKGAKGIALIDNTSGPKTKLRYVFDVQDTYKVRNLGKDPQLWNLPVEGEQLVADYLQEQLSLEETEGGFAESLHQAAKESMQEWLPDALEELRLDVTGTFLEELDEQNQEVEFRELMTNSVWYVLLNRCGLDVQEYLDAEDFRHITDFNQLKVLGHLGSAVNEISRPVLMQIGRYVLNDLENDLKTVAKEKEVAYNEFNTLIRESNTDNTEDREEKKEETDYERDQLQPERRVSDSRYQPERDERNHRQVRNDAERVSEKSQGSQVQHSDTAEPSGQSSDGDRQPGKTESRRPDERTSGERSGTGQNGRRDGMDQTHEPDQGTGRGAGDSGDYLQLSLFPTEEEQLGEIRKAAAALEQPAAFLISDEVVDDILRTGSGQKNTLFHITARLIEGLDNEEMRSFLKDEYGTGGKGFTIDGQKISIWYDNDGIRIRRGDSARRNFDRMVTWEEAANRIRDMYEDGNYVDNLISNNAIEQEQEEMTNLLALHFRDTCRNWEKKQSYSDWQDVVSGAWTDQEEADAIVYRFEWLQKYMDENPGDYHRWEIQHNPEYFERFQDLQRERSWVDQKFTVERPALSFITQDEIDAVLRRGGITAGGRNRIYEYFMEHHDMKDAAEFLKNEYGTGGSSPGIPGADASDASHDAKGLKLAKGKIGSPEVEVLLKWNKVAERVRQLIRTDDYLSPEEMEKYEERQEAQRLADLEEAQQMLGEQLEQDTLTAEDITDLRLVDSEYMSGTRTKIHDFDCKVKGEANRLQYTLEYHDDGEGFTIHTEKDDIWNRMSTQELERLDVKLGQEVLYYHYHNKTVNADTLDELREIRDEIMEEESSYFTAISQRVWTDYDKKEKELSGEVEVSEEKESLEEINGISETIPATNFRITDDELGQGTAKEKFRANIMAIQLLKKCEDENRNATPEEQEILSRYVGWGGLADAFDETKAAWETEYLELKTVLTPEEYAAARASTLNAHYTQPIVIESMYQVLENLGFTKGNILEPSMGVGNFFGMLPEKMRNSRLYGVELDPVSGRIAKQLYPKADITVGGFETTDRRDFFDLAIGNVPFGQYQVNDKAYNKLNFSIHNYFFAKALDQVRPGGVVAFVTSRYTMDAKDSTVRRYLAQRAELLGAIRLPNDAFKKNAGAEVVSDIIFLQKRDRPLDIVPEWTQTGQTEDGFAINRYFIDHPEMVLGRQEPVSTAHGMDYTVNPIEGLELSDQLHDAVKYIHGTYQEAELPELGEGEAIDTSIPADPNVKNYSYAIVDGQVYYRENSRMVRPDLNATAEARVKGLVGLRDCVQELIDLQMDVAVPDSTITQKQAELNSLYDSFSAKYGLINDRANRLAYADDSSYYLLCALEVIDEDGKLERKADMFTKRTIKPHQAVAVVDTASEALAVSISEKACVDMGYMSQLTGKTKEELAGELQGVIFRVPGQLEKDGTPHYVTADEYLSGNVRRKLRQAQRAAQQDPVYAVNVEALTAAQPKDLDASEIEVRLGATWIDKEYIQQFMYETFNTPFYLQRSIEVNYSSFTAEWQIKGKSSVSYNDVAAYTTYGTSRANAYKILEDSLNLRDVRIYDTIEDADGKERRVLNAKETTLAAQKQQAIREAFRDWIWRDPERRQTLVRQYNEEMNSTRPREYDGSHITFGGMNPAITLREHQKSAIAHVLYGGNTLLAHEVGAGKTFEMVAASMEAKRLGLCQKSLFVVPNHLTEQWASEFLRLYPSANILVTTKKDFETHNRKKFCARIATGDYDAIIMGHSQFERIPISRERQERLLYEQIDEITEGIAEVQASGGERFTVKQLERTRKSLEARLEKLQAEGRKDDVVTFEQLGVDRLFVDEAHNYKNLFLYTKMRNVAGLSTSDAQKSSDMFAKCRYMDEITGNRGVIFATGTPVSNSMTELYTMQRYLQYERLQELNMTHFDCWASRFGETVTALELAPEGTGYRARTRFSKFFNLPELMNLFKEVADIKTADQLNLPTPEVEYHNIVAQPTEHQQEMVKALSERASLVHSGTVDPSQDNMLKITSDGRKLGLDQRIVNQMLPDEPGTKVNQCVDNIMQIWRDGKADKLTQLVFCDISTPQAKAPASKAAKTLDNPLLHALEGAVPLPEQEPAFTVYDDIRQKLIAQGMPADQIAFIHEANTEVRKKELFSKVRTGQVRVLLGSTAKMGAGTNVQDRLVALHDLDCPWRPGDLAQRKGRIERQGNQNPLVHVYRYVTEGTFDAYLWQTVENKQKFISQIMTSKSPVRSCDDVDETALSFAEIKALCAGDPRIKERMDLDVEVSRLKLMKADHQSKQYRLEDQLLKYFPEEIEKHKGFIKGFESDLEVLAAHPHPEDGFAGMEIRGDLLTDKENAGAALLDACKEVKTSDPVQIGSYRGYAMSVEFSAWKQEYTLLLKGQMTHRATLGTDPRGNLTRIDNALAQMPQRLEAAKAQLDNLYQQQAAAKEEVGKPFLYEEELRCKNARLVELDTLLNIDGKGQAHTESVVAKSTRPSVLDNLKRPVQPRSTDKKPKQHEEVR